MSSSPRILVTGGAGYIGSHCVAELCNAGHYVVVVDNLSEGRRHAIDSRATFYKFDINETDKLNEVLRDEDIEAVLHCAGYALVGESMSTPGEYYQNNVVGGLSLLEAMRKAEVTRIVFSSSCAVYGIPDVPGPISEDTPRKPINPYGETKLVFERMLSWYQKVYGFRCTIFRYFNAAGAGFGLGENRRVETHLIPNILRVALGEATVVKVYGNDYPTPDGTAIRDYIHVLDLAEIHRIALLNDVVGAFNLGTGQVASVQEVIDCCRKVTGHSLPLQYEGRRDGDPPTLYASSDLVECTFGWRVARGLEVCVRDAWAWMRNNRKETIPSRNDS